MALPFGITTALLEHVKREEGWRAEPYLCPAGYPTIGYGHRIPSMNHPPIGKEQGELFLVSDLAKARQLAFSYSPNLASEAEPRAAAVIDFLYNLGPGNYGTSTLRKRVNEKQWPEAAKEMRRWVYANDPDTGKKVKLPGLVRRRETTAGWLEGA